MPDDGIFPPTVILSAVGGGGGPVYGFSLYGSATYGDSDPGPGTNWAIFVTAIYTPNVPISVFHSHNVTNEVRYAPTVPITAHYSNPVRLTVNS